MRWILYGQPDIVARFVQMSENDPHLREMTREYRALSDTGSLAAECCDQPIVLLDPTDTEALKVLYQKESKQVYFPVCGKILSIQDPEADRIMEMQLEKAPSYYWHKEANRFRMMRGYLLRNPVSDAVPSHIQLEHTSYCNARCIMCGHAIYGNNGAEHISDRLIERIEPLLPTCEVMVLHGYGEPLLTKNLERLLDLYKKYQVEVTTNTNLSYLPDALLEKLTQTASHIRISCDGVTKEVYEQIRPGLKYDTFLQNLEKLHQKAPAMGLMMEIVIMRQNVEQLPLMVRFAKAHGISQISFNRLGAHPVLNNEMDCLTHYPHLTSHYLKLALEEGAKAGVAIFYPNEWLLDGESAARMQAERSAAKSLPFRIEPLECAREHRQIVHNAYDLRCEDPQLVPGIYRCDGMCDSLLGRTNLDLEGNVYTCCMNTLCKVGNLYQESDQEFYNAPALVKMREMFYQGEIPKYCDNCSYVMNHTLALAEVNRR